LNLKIFATLILISGHRIGFQNVSFFNFGQPVICSSTRTSFLTKVSIHTVSAFLLVNPFVYLVLSDENHQVNVLPIKVRDIFCTCTLLCCTHCCLLFQAWCHEWNECSSNGTRVWVCATKQSLGIKWHQMPLNN